MADKKSEKIEREYVIPLRDKCRPVPIYKKTPKAVKTIKEFIVRHMKVYDRDLNKVKLDRYLNEFLWSRGIKNPVHKVKVKAVKDEKGIVHVELVEFPKNLQQKKAREDKFRKLAEKESEKKKKEKSPKEGEEAKESPEEQTKKEIEEKEDKASTIEAGKEMEKELAKKHKHETKIDQKIQKTKSEHSKGQGKR